MDVFLAGTDVTLSVQLQDKNGNPITVTGIEYRVTDQNGAEVVTRSTLNGFVSGSPQASIPVPAEINALPDGVVSGVRNVDLFCVVAGNTVVMSAPYGIETADPLQIGVNSFQNIAQAEFLALSIPNTPSWDAAVSQDRVAALIDARSHIVQLNFSQLNSNINWGQDSLNFVPEGTYSTNYVSSNGMFLFNGNLALLTPQQFSKLPEKFVFALRQAQLVEADAILGGNVVEGRRREGLMLETIGDVKQMYRPGKPLDLPVCKRALGYLSYFVTFAKRIGRG